MLAELVALPMETFVARRTALALLETYVGPRAGRRVLQGLIRRDDGEAIDAAVTARGGEILHFIGDAVLVVFSTSARGNRGQACTAALEAARGAFSGIATVNMRSHRAGTPEIRFGVGLHVGEVVYGNVGTPDRFDFTVMGAAVNRAARLQSLTKELARPVLTSADFAACIDEPVESLGCHVMKGVKEPQEIFAHDGF